MMRPCTLRQQTLASTSSASFSKMPSAAPNRRPSRLEPQITCRGAVKDGLMYITPWDDVFFHPDIEMSHEIKVTINKPRTKVFDAWRRREYLKYFPLLDSHGAHKGRAEEHQHTFYYKYHDLPALEIRWTEGRTEIKEGEMIVFKTVEGAPVAGQVEFRDAQGGDAQATEVTLKVQYLLPTVLGEHVGHLAVRTDVTRKLTAMITAYGAAL